MDKNKEDMDRKFERYCRKWTAEAAAIDDQKGRIAYFQEQLPELLTDNPTVGSILTHMAQGRRWPNVRRPGLFSQEVLLYLDPARRFSVRLYFHSPNAYTAIHDHTSWGISGTPFGSLSVVRYTHDGMDQEGYVQLRQKQQKNLSPGAVEFTRPWDDGIHKTGSADSSLNVMISIYGRPGRRLYVNQYDEQTGKVERIYPPRLYLRNLAAKALSVYGQP